MDNSDIKQAQEREYYRIDDDVSFDYFELSTQQLNGKVPQQEIQEKLFGAEEYQQFLLMRELYQIDNEFKKTLVGLSREQAELVDCLDLLNKKITRLSQYMTASQRDSVHEINISIGGFAFNSTTQIPENTRLKTKFIFYPSCLGIVASATVVLSRHLPKKSPDLPYMISGKFLDLSPLDDQIIQQHIMQKEMHKTE